MTNPFRDNGAANNFDLPLTTGERDHRASQPGQVQNGLLYDPITKSGSPNLQILLDTIHATRDAQHAKMTQGLLAEMQREFGVLRDRIKVLEAALLTAQTEVADAIRTSIVGYLGEEPEPTPGENRAMQQTKEFWEGKD